MEQQRRSAQSGRFVLPVMSIPMIWRVTRHGSSGSSSWRRDTSSVTQSKCTCRARAAHIEPRSSRITCCVRLQSTRRFTRRLVTFLLASKWWRSCQRRLWTSGKSSFIWFAPSFNYYSLMMEMANFKGSKFYYLNGHFFYWTFFLSRPLLIVPYWSLVNRHLQQMDTTLETIGTGHLLMNLMMSVALDALNCYWTVFLSKGKFQCQPQ